MNLINNNQTYEERKETLDAIADVIHGKGAIFIFNPYDRDHYCLRLCEDTETNKTVEFVFQLKPLHQKDTIYAYNVLEKFEVYSYDEYKKILDNGNKKDGCWEFFMPGPELQV